MTIKALVLDLDGTLYITNEVTIIERVCITRTYSYLKRAGVLAKMSKRQMMDLGRNMKMGLVSYTVRHMSKKWKIAYTPFNNYVFDNDPKEFGIVRNKRLVNLLAKVSKHYKVYVFTNSPKIWAVRAIRDIGLSKYLPQSRIIWLELLGGYMKPETQAYKMMLKRIKLRPEEILFFDDRKENVVAARKLGIKSEVVSNTGKVKRNSIYSIFKYALKRAK